MMAEKACLDSLETAKKAVDDLYHYRDHYFESHSLEHAIKKPDDVAEQMKACIQTLDQLQEQIENKAQYLMLRGRALNVLSGFSQEAQECLAKSVKLDPKLAEAWVALGETYWKNTDIDSAKNCFQGALNHGQDKVALRNLSMVLRQVGGTSREERSEHVEESVEKAKAAVQLDIKDGTSWLILGNAYLSLFFTSNQNPKIIKQSLSAYQQAERDSVTNCNPDLHFNRATLYRYQEEYELALMGYGRASLLDPTWPEPAACEQSLLAYLAKVQEFVDNKGKVRKKKLHSLIDSLKDSDLGPYSGGSYTSQSGKSINLEAVMLEGLKAGVNECKVTLGKVVCSVHYEETVPFTFCMADRTGACFSVTVYNVAPGWGVKIGDSVAIPEPFLQPVNVQYKDKVFKFHNIRIDSPVVMVVNGRKQGMDKQAPSVLAVSAVSE